ncbi:vitamin K epoxide reductase family protein [Candidatus Kryptobacter tengchongensis]|nr:vitamin K epoxide reductase family protein [Candidatus Kryptobacter tengchongensis]CUS79881.1 Uncharacterized membrane protein [Candidatus Kryptobacter tengchongensis]CUT04468.1 Uncharacterized membrane protein [Candidatus Kryptobacter tengchongensis]
MVAKIAIITLSILGFYISLYFTFVYYQIVSPSKFLVPKICKLTENTCQMIIYSEYAKLLGLPNFIYGLAYYFAILLFAILESNGYIKTAIAIASWFVVAVGVYLVYILTRVLKVNCLLCFVSHILNFLIAILILLK